MNSLDNKTIHGKSYANMFDVSETSTMWKPWYFSLPKIIKSTVIYYEAAKHHY